MVHKKRDGLATTPLAWLIFSITLNSISTVQKEVTGDHLTRTPYGENGEVVQDPNFQNYL